MRLLLLLLCLGASAAAAEEGPPPPPVVLDEWVDPADPPAKPPTPAKPPEKKAEQNPETKAPAADPPVEILSPPLFSGPLLGATLGGVGAVAGASVGAVLLLSADFAAGVPELFFLGVVLSTPALASLIAGFVVTALVVPHPGFDDFASVAACSAIGCVGTWLILALGFGGGLSGCNPSGCNSCNSCGPGGGGGDGDRGLPAAAGAGLGAIAGLGVGAFAVYAATGVDDVERMKPGAAIGILVGAFIGGAIGGAIVGFD